MASRGVPRLALAGSTERKRGSDITSSNPCVEFRFSKKSLAPSVLTFVSAAPASAEQELSRAHSTGLKAHTELVCL